MINGEVLRFLRTPLPGLSAVTVFDLDAGRARSFADAYASRYPELNVEVADSLGGHARRAPAGVAGVPGGHPAPDASHCLPGTLVLHLPPRAVLASTNIVDYADHVCRTSTSLHLAVARLLRRRAAEQGVAIELAEF